VYVAVLGRGGNCVGFVWICGFCVWFLCVVSVGFVWGHLLIFCVGWGVGNTT
jgi:hypothetical protein